MLNSKWVAALVLFVIAVQPTFADDRAKILGTWKLMRMKRRCNQQVSGHLLWERIHLATASLPQREDIWRL